MSEDLDKLRLELLGDLLLPVAGENDLLGFCLLMLSKNRHRKLSEIDKNINSILNLKRDSIKSLVLCDIVSLDLFNSQ